MLKQSAAQNRVAGRTWTQNQECERTRSMPPKSAASEASQEKTEQLLPGPGPSAGPASTSLPGKASYSTSDADAAIGSTTDILPGSVPHDPNVQEDGTDHRKPSPNSSNASRQDTVAQVLSRSGSQKKATSPADVLEEDQPTEDGGLATKAVDGNGHGREKVEIEDDVIARVLATGKSEKTLHSQSMRFKVFLETQDSVPYGLFSRGPSLEVSVEPNDFDLT